nr:hypothetical protein [Tanacetum cinerariifolium]
PIRNLDELNVIEVFPSPYFPSAKEREAQNLMGESCDLTASDVERILEAKSVTANGPMAPACGLYLAHVKYDLP